MYHTLSALALASLATLAAACTTADPLDVQGTWSLQFTTAQAGTCFAPNRVLTGSLSARLEEDTYLLTPANPEPTDTATGRFLCSETKCDIDLTLTSVDKTQGGASVTITTELDITIDERLVISGTGDVTMTGGITCAHALTVGGTVQ